jgi:hypothetical protein
VWALYLAGAGALFTVAVCLATTTLLYVMARSRLFRQRNGAFVAWSAVCLLGVLLVIVHHGLAYISSGSRARVVVQEPAVAPAPGETPLLRDAFPGRKDPSSGPVVRILRDTKVSIDGKPYLAKEGELYPLVDVGVDERGASQVRFSVGLHDVLIPKAATVVVSSDCVPGLAGNADAGKTAAANEPPAPPAKEFELPKGVSKKEQEAASQREAIRRYPELGRAGSPKNQAFVSAVKEQRHTGAVEFFDDPNWPLMLAEFLADKDGWKRADVVEPEPAPRDVPPRAEPARRPPNQ